VVVGESCGRPAACSTWRRTEEAAASGARRERRSLARGWSDGGWRVEGAAVRSVEGAACNEHGESQRPVCLGDLGCQWRAPRGMDGSEGGERCGRRDEIVTDNFLEIGFGCWLHSYDFLGKLLGKEGTSRQRCSSNLLLSIFLGKEKFPYGFVV